MREQEEAEQQEAAEGRRRLLNRFRHQNRQEQRREEEVTARQREEEQRAFKRNHGVALKTNAPSQRYLRRDKHVGQRNKRGMVLRRGGAFVWQCVAPLPKQDGM